MRSLWILVPQIMESFYLKRRFNLKLQTLFVLRRNVSCVYFKQNRFLCLFSRF